MISKWAWNLTRLTRRLWFRATLISLLAVAAALASLLIGPYLPQGLSAQIGADAVDNILNIIASSMLAVTTFSLSTMVAAYSAATSNVTPRATKLLVEDKTTQNVLATFVGSFLYSVVALITLSMGAYGERGRVVLFAMTIVVVALIVVTLLRWIDYLLGLGRVGETTEEVEEAAIAAMRDRRKLPNLGGVPAEEEDHIPQDATPVFSETIGYIQHVDIGALDDHAVAIEGKVYLVALPGTFVDRRRPLAWCSGRKKAPDNSDVASAFSIGQERSFDQDPRFGLCVMAEIAQRALSPALNDPGTAIDVIGRAVRILSTWTEPDEERPNVRCEHVYVPSIRIEDLFDDVLTPIARDAAGNVEVQIRLQKAYAALARAGDPRFREVALAHSKAALTRAKAAVASEQDFQRIRAAADDVGWTPDRPQRRRSRQGARK